MVILPSCVGDTRDLAGTQDYRPPSRAVQIEVDFRDSVGLELLWVKVLLVGANGTFERTVPIAE